jgi:hypothetical protein
MKRSNKAQLARAKAKKELARRRGAFERKWRKYRFATVEDCENLALPPSYLGTLILKKNGTLPDWVHPGEPDARRLPRKLKRNELAGFAQEILEGWFELPMSDRRYYARQFWADPFSKGILAPDAAKDLTFFLSLGCSEVFRAIADYIDALKSDKRLAIATKVAAMELELAAKRKRPLTWREIQRRFWPEYKGRNFQKFLKRRGARFLASGKWRGGHNVYGTTTNGTHSRVCAATVRDHQSRRARNNAENGSHRRRK